VHEPDCAIRAAVAAGEIDAGRHESYVRMLAGEER
jgi:putative ribosome biogenesis GTPase RsgA